MKNIKLIRYAGAKDKYLDSINKHIDKTTNTTYIEPFLGSGAVFLNLEKEFDEYIINDIDPNIIKIFNTVKNSTYEEFMLFHSKVIHKFGDIKNDKEAYYSFRNKFNEKLWKSNTIDEGFGLMLLYSSCINSLARFGPKGFNQGYGNRLYMPDEETWNIVHNKLQKTTIYNLDFLDLMSKIHDKLENSLLFLDPPYFYGGDVGYANVNKEWYLNYLKLIEESKSNIIYTDIKHNDLSNKWNIEILRTMRNISPNKSSEYTKEEAIYFNF